MTIPCPDCGRSFGSDRGMKIHRTKTHGEWREHECPTCGDFLETYRGLKCHHTNVHGESIAGEEVNCSYCGDVLRRRRNVVEKQDQFFCNVGDCQSKWNKELPKEQHGSWSGGKDNLVCDQCGDNITRKPSRSNYHKKSFCKKECYFEWKRENHPTGKDNPNWQGGHADYYGENWNQKRKETLERDNYSCKICDMTREEHYEAYGKDLDVHHKIPIAEFDEPEDANYLINLLTTCRSCHGQLDTISRREANRKPTIPA